MLYAGERAPLAYHVILSLKNNAVTINGQDQVQNILHIYVHKLQQTYIIHSNIDKVRSTKVVLL